MPGRFTSTDETASPEAVTELILRIFRTNGRLLLAGDELVASLGLTSARWQLLGSIVAAGESQPVVRLAREMGVSRQAVQRIANDLEREGVVVYLPNPHHKRAQLVMLTDHGRTLFERALMLQRPWVEGLSNGLTKSQVETASTALDLILARLDLRGTPADGSAISSEGRAAG